MGNTVVIHKQRQKCGAVMKKVHFCISVSQTNNHLFQLSKFDLKYDFLQLCEVCSIHRVIVDIHILDKYSLLWY